jgi:CRISPR-associated endonuclease/helicase Cas3
MGPFDSIAQAAGRCDREGKLTAAAGKPAGRVVVFRPEDDAHLPAGYGEATQITESLLARGVPSIFDTTHIRRYFHELYAGDQDPHNIEALRAKLDFPNIAEAFRMIDDRTKAVLVPYGDGPELIEKFRNPRALTPQEWRNLYRTAQRFQVGLYPGEFFEAQRMGAVERLTPDDDRWACSPLYYSGELGLDLAHPPAPSDLIA